jgi:hypothetical protein
LAQEGTNFFAESVLADRKPEVSFGDIRSRKVELKLLDGYNSTPIDYDDDYLFNESVFLFSAFNVFNLTRA